MQILPTLFSDSLRMADDSAGKRAKPATGRYAILPIAKNLGSLAGF
jgi:hypothetical protein